MDGRLWRLQPSRCASLTPVLATTFLRRWSWARSSGAQRAWSLNPASARPEVPAASGDCRLKADCLRNEAQGTTHDLLYLCRCCRYLRYYLSEQLVDLVGPDLRPS